MQSEWIQYLRVLFLIIDRLNYVLWIQDLMRAALRHEETHSWRIVGIDM